jgi:mannose-6-phosphate isomerase-like protein (cupin superfamily)
MVKRTMNIFDRPWGTYQVLLEDDNCKVKKIVVQPGQKLSLQSHEKRSELWKVIDGNGEVLYKYQ